MLDSIESAIEDIRNGKMVIVVDDEDRENEGDFVTAARNVTPEVINFMSKHGRGLICAPHSGSPLRRIAAWPHGQQQYRAARNSFHRIDRPAGAWLYDRHFCSRPRKTIQALINPDTKPDDLGRPGHIFPLRAKKEAFCAARVTRKRP